MSLFRFSASLTAFVAKNVSQPPFCLQKLATPVTHASPVHLQLCMSITLVRLCLLLPSETSFSPLVGHEGTIRRLWRDQPRFRLAMHLTRIHQPGDPFCDRWRQQAMRDIHVDLLAVWPNYRARTGQAGKQIVTRCGPQLPLYTP